MMVFPSKLGFGALLLVGAVAHAQNVAVLQSGEQVYRETCVACHGTGVGGAPAFGDRKAWGKLVGEGQAVLTAHGWLGVRGMPAKGGRADLSLEEFARAVAWMARGSGGQWRDPDAAMMERIRVEEGKRIVQLRKKAG